MGLLGAAAAGIIPMLIYPLFLYWMDHYEKEPLHLLVGVFLWGFVPAAILSLIAQLLFGAPLMLFDETGTLANTLSAIVAAPVSEEFFKGLAVLAVYLIWRREFDGVFDGIIYGGLVGFGFAAIENVLYFLDADISVVLLRTIIFGLNHAFFTSLTGIGFGFARHSPKWWVRLFAPVLGLLAAISAHMLHNAAVTFSEGAPALCFLAILADWGGVLFVFVIMVMALRRERTWILTQLAEEVSNGVLPESHVIVAGSITQRALSRLTAFFTGGPASWWRLGRYYRAMTELAYRKHARSRTGDQGATQEQIEAARTRMVALVEALPDRS
jgi:RsiW-degrading membrane proteinase PrsW (M82 family)